jgi:hypothetical protein
MKRRAFLFATGVFILALFIRLPASFATWGLPPEIQLRDVEGSFWHGRAAAIGIGGVRVQEQVSWDFQPRALLDAKLAWMIEGRLAERSSRLELAIRPRGVELNAVDLALPLEPLAALHPRLKPVQLGATLRLTAKSLRARSPVVASVTVEHLFTPQAPHAELGSYRLEGTGQDDGKGAWRIATVSGVLRMDGKGTFDIARSKIGGQLTLTPQSPIPGLSPWLASLPRAGGGFVLAF